MVDPLSQIPDAPRLSGAPRKHQSEATLVLRGRGADALRDKAALEHARALRMKQVKLAGFVAAAVVALGGGAYLARLSSGPAADLPAHSAAPRVESVPVQAAATVATPEPGAQYRDGQYRGARPADQSDAESQAAAVTQPPTAMNGAESGSLRGDGAESAARRGEQAERAGGASKQVPSEPESDVLTLDQLPSAD